MKRTKLGCDEVRCKKCGSTFINEYRRGGSREWMEGLDSFGDSRAGDYRDQNVCNDCAKEIGTFKIKK